MSTNKLYNNHKNCYLIDLENATTETDYTGGCNQGLRNVRLR